MSTRVVLSEGAAVEEVDADIIVVAGCALGFVAPKQPPHVLHVDPGTEMQKSSVQGDDLLVSIDGVDTRTMVQSEVAKHLKGASELVFERPKARPEAEDDESDGEPDRKAAAAPASAEEAPEPAAPAPRQSTDGEGAANALASAMASASGDQRRRSRSRHHRRGKHRHGGSSGGAAPGASAPAAASQPPGPPPPPGQPPFEWAGSRPGAPHEPPPQWLGSMPPPWGAPPPWAYPPPDAPGPLRGPKGRGKGRRSPQRVQQNEAGGYSLVAEQVPPSVNSMDVLNEYFGRFGRVSAMQINHNRHEAVITFHQAAEAEAAMRYPVLNDPAIGLRPWRAKAGQRGPHEPPGGAPPPQSQQALSSPPAADGPAGGDAGASAGAPAAGATEPGGTAKAGATPAVGNLQLEAGSVLEKKRKRDEVEERRIKLLQGLTDQLRLVMVKISDERTTEKNREALQGILDSIKKKISALTPKQPEPEPPPPPPVRPRPTPKSWQPHGAPWEDGSAWRPRRLSWRRPREAVEMHTADDGYETEEMLSDMDEEEYLAILAASSADTPAAASEAAVPGGEGAPAAEAAPAAAGAEEAAGEAAAEAAPAAAAAEPAAAPAPAEAAGEPAAGAPAGGGAPAAAEPPPPLAALAEPAPPEGAAAPAEPAEPAGASAEPPAEQPAAAAEGAAAEPS